MNKMPKNTYIESVKEYYNSSQKWYTWFYSDKKSLGLHYGFWDTPHTSREDALLNQYRVIKDILQSQKGQRVLDAGCGVGGASLWLAEHTEANYVGITISDVQGKLARTHIQKRNLEDRVNVYIQDYFSTTFEDSSFDSVFAIESFCYAYPTPAALYTEMYRVLKPGGTLVISDGVYLRKPESVQEQKMSDDYCIGFKLAAMSTPEEIVSFLSESGFSDVKTIDKTPDIKKSIEDIDWRSRLVSPFRILKYIGLVSKTEEENLLATSHQKDMYERGLFGYKIFVAQKKR